jgi:hypothetical protein
MLKTYYDIQSSRTKFNLPILVNWVNFMSFSDFQGTNLAVFEAGKLISRGIMVCKNGLSSAELQNLAARFLQIVRNLYIAYGNSPSLLGPEQPFFPEWAGTLVGNSINVLVYDSSVIRRLTAFPVNEVNTEIGSMSPCTMTPGEGRSFGASEGKRKRFPLK